MRARAEEYTEKELDEGKNEGLSGYTKMEWGWVVEFARDACSVLEALSRLRSTVGNDCEKSADATVLAEDCFLY